MTTRKTTGKTTSRPRSPLAMVLLALLAEEPMHPYRMQRLIERRGKTQVVNVARSNSVYQVIERLLREGLLRVHRPEHPGEGEEPQVGPSRIVYELTPEGRETLFRWLETMLSTPAREFPEFPAALAMIAIMSPDVVRRQLEERIRALEEHLAQAEADAELAARMELPRLFTLEDEYRTAMVRAELDWLRGLVDDLRSGRLSWTEESVRASSAAHESPA